MSTSPNNPYILMTPCKDCGQSGYFHTTCFATKCKKFNPEMENNVNEEEQ